MPSAFAINLSFRRWWAGIALACCLAGCGEPVSEFPWVAPALVPSRGDAADDPGVLYLGEEGYGVWMLPAGPGRPAELPSFATIVDGGLTADVEGLALYLTPGTDGSSVRRYLVVSSQGDDSFAIYDTDTGIHMGSFRVGGHPDIDDVSDTDGVAATSILLPGFPEGLLVVQDGSNPGGNQNFKLLSWTEVV